MTIQDSESSRNGGAEDAGRLDPGSPVPLYRQLLADLERRISAGQFDRDNQIPSEACIERTYGVSRITVRRALQELEHRGLIERHQGRATRLATPEAQASPALEAEIAGIISLGFRTEAQVLDVGIVPAPEEVAARLALRPGEPVHRSLRLRRLEGEPLCRSLAYLPARFAPALSEPALEREPLLLLLVRSGLVIGRVEQSIGATAACGTLARCLDTAEGSPLLLVERLFRDDRDRPVELVQLHFRADRYRYHLTLTAEQGRTGGGD
ncbi:MAG: GntR family transcriptional regulator [Tistlia sp.]|uniref:GntR family transcriptional regulator n=1 Tax=Tistlia sp. TaxID=3057121 RepID=UPI0034A23FFB